MRPEDVSKSNNLERWNERDRETCIQSPRNICHVTVFDNVRKLMNVLFFAEMEKIEFHVLCAYKIFYKILKVDS